MNITFFTILAIVITLLALIVIPQFLIRSAVRQVIRNFRKYDAVSRDKAKTLDELGYGSPDLLQRLLTIKRDYNVPAVSVLMRMGIVQMTDDKKVFLSEEDLFASKLYKSQPGKGL